MPRDKQLLYISTLLRTKGEMAASQLRGRVERNQGVVAKGFRFDVDVLKEALREWEHGRVAGSSECASDAALAAAAAGAEGGR